MVTHFLGDWRGATARETDDRFVRLIQGDHMRLAELAPLVSRAAADGDPAALAITRRAAEHLASTVRRIHVSGPVVLAGSVLTNDGPVREHVLDLLAERAGPHGGRRGGRGGLAGGPRPPAGGPREGGPRRVHLPRLSPRRVSL
ncbi:hypothetical protein ACFSTC_44380 [Nonomuraea ferruginea]